MSWHIHVLLIPSFGHGLLVANKAIHRMWSSETIIRIQNILPSIVLQWTDHHALPHSFTQNMILFSILLALLLLLSVDQGGEGRGGFPPFSSPPPLPPPSQ